MKKMMKKILPVMVIMALAVCFMSVSAFATDDIIIIDDQMPVAVVEEIEIPDEDVPLADVPLADAPVDVVANAAVQETGDSTMAWVVVALLAGIALVGVNVEVKRNEN